MRSLLLTLMLTLGLSLGVSAQKGLDKTTEGGTSGQNIVQVAIALNSAGSPYEGQFDTLIAAVLAADPVIVNTLTGKGQYTVFAPTDAAFLSLGLDPTNIGTIPTETLTTILAYHVAPGRRYAEDVLGSSRIRTINKRFFFVSPDAVITDAVGRTSNIIATDVES